MIVEDDELQGKSHYGEPRPRTSNRSKKTNTWKYRDFIEFEDDESHFFNFRKLDIIHVRMKKVNYWILTPTR